MTSAGLHWVKYQHRRSGCIMARYLSGHRASCFASMPAYEDSHQRGFGKIRATSYPNAGGSSIATHLSEVSHSSPMRLVPSRRSHPTHHTMGTNYEAAIVHLSSYGGGFVPGDIIDLDIDVRGEGGIVYVLTQGGSRIYRPGDDFRQHGNYNHQSNGKSNQSIDSSSRAKLCQSTINCTVDPGATLLYLPDPTVPYYQTSFEEKRLFNCKYNQGAMGSIISVDWYSSGRRASTGMEVERWAFDYLATRMEFHVTDEHSTADPEPVLIDSMTLDNTTASTSGTLSPAAISMGKNHDSYATILLHGPNSLEVAKRATALSHYLAGLKTRVRQANFGETEGQNEYDLVRLSNALGGRVIMSVNSIENDDERNNQEVIESQTHMVRILAPSNEDIYRILHYCLKPCSQFLGGLEPYKDRIHSSGTVRSSGSAEVTNLPQNSKSVGPWQSKRSVDELQAIANSLVYCKQMKSSDQGGQTNAWFHACLFSDSSLPVGSFAHSLGIEAASQVGLFNHNEGHSTSVSSCSEEDLADYVYAASRSTARFSTPIILGAYSLVSTAFNAEQSCHSWLEIDRYTDKLLKSNGPGRRASMDQGLGFLRIAPALLERNDKIEITNLWKYIKASINNKSNYQESLLIGSQSLQHSGVHAAPLYGLLAGSLGIPPLDACRLFSFGAARDSVSAAVRLNLLGPVAGLSLLSKIGQQAIEEGTEDALLSMIACHDINNSVKELYKDCLRCATTCAPLMDAAQPCHDLLSVRLFRT